KPGNLLLDRSGTVKLLDLGLARFSEPGKDNLTERFDENKAILGTADYLAPEQARGDVVDIRADVYSLGGTFYFLLTGKAPFEDGSITQKLLWSQTKAPKAVRDVRPEVPVEMAAVLERMMAKDLKERYQTPQAVIEALKPWTATPVPPPAADEFPRRSAAAVAPLSQALVPSTPAPRSVPGDLVRSRPSSGGVAAVRPAGPRTPAPKTVAPKTPSPAAGPRSAPRSGGARPLAPIIRGPAPATEPPPRRRKAAPAGKSARGPGLFLAAAGGGAALVILGIVLAWLFVGGRSHHDQATTPEPVTASRGTAPPPVAVQPKPVPAGAVIPPDQAANYVNQKVTIEMTVLSVGKATSTELYFLNSKANYRAEDNFSVTLDKRVLGQLGAANDQELKAKLKDKTVRVTGVITKYQNRPQIVVDNADQIQVVNR
ncbi:MAG TPA: protein kinase, partial [Gemmataceae bacterium]